MTYPELGFGSISARGSGVSLDLVSCVKIPKACEEVYLEVIASSGEDRLRFPNGPGRQGSRMAPKGVKTGLEDQRKILDGTVFCIPPKLNPTAQNLIP